PEAQTWRPLLWGVPAFLLVFGMLSAERLVPFRRIHALIAIGDSSYSLYLTHTLAIPVLVALLLRLSGPRAIETAWALLPMAVGCVVIGWISYVFRELPVTRGLQAARRRWRVHAEVNPRSPPNAPNSVGAGD